MSDEHGLSGSDGGAGGDGVDVVADAEAVTEPTLAIELFDGHLVATLTLSEDYVAELVEQATLNPYAAGRFGREIIEGICTAVMEATSE